MILQEYSDIVFEFPNYGKSANAFKCLATAEEICQKVIKGSPEMIPTGIMHLLSFSDEDLIQSELTKKEDALKKLLSTTKIERQGNEVSLHMVIDEDEEITGHVELVEAEEKKTYLLYVDVEDNDQKILLALAAVCRNLLKEYQFGNEAECIVISANNVFLNGMKDLVNCIEYKTLLCEGMHFAGPSAATQELEADESVFETGDVDADNLGRKILGEDLRKRAFLPAYLLSKLYCCEELSEEDHEVIAGLSVAVDQLSNEAEEKGQLFRKIRNELEIEDAADVLIASDENTKYNYALVDIRRDKDTWEAFSPLLTEAVLNENYKGTLIGAVNRNSMPVGAMAVSEDDVNLTIDYLYVAEDSRRCGVGSFLISALMDLSADIDQPKEVTMQFPTDQLALFFFFNSLRCFNIEFAADEYFISNEEIAGSKLLQDLAKKKFPVKNYSQLPSNYKEHLLNELEANNLIHLINQESFEGSLIEDLSVVKVKDADIAGTILTKKSDKNAKTLELFAIYSKDQATTVELLSSVCDTMLEKYPGYSLVTTPINEQSSKLLSKFFDDPKVNQRNVVVSSNELTF